MSEFSPHHLEQPRVCLQGNAVMDDQQAAAFLHKTDQGIGVSVRYGGISLVKIGKNQTIF